MKSPNQARPKSTEKRASQSGHFPVKGMTTTRCTPTSKTQARLYNTGVKINSSYL